MPTVEEYLRSTERPRRVSLPPPVAIDVPERVRRVTRATHPPRIRPKRHLTRAQGRRALSIALFAGIVGLGVLAATEDTPEHERSAAPIPSLPSVPSSVATFELRCFVSQRPGLTATADIVRVLVNVRAEASRFPQSDCRKHIWATDTAPPVDDFGTLGVVLPPLTITDVTGPLTATAGDTVQFTVSDFRTRTRFETELARSPDGSEWRLVYLRRLAE